MQHDKSLSTKTIPEPNSVKRVLIILNLNEFANAKRIAIVRSLFFFFLHEFKLKTQVQMY